MARVPLFPDRSILHVGKFYPPHRGGIESVVHDLAVRQSRTDHVSVVVANDPARTEISESEGVHITRVARYATVASMPVCPGLLSAIHRAPAALVHLHMPNPGAAAALLLSGHKGKLVITHHADTLGRKSLRRLSDPFVIRAMRRAGAIIVTSKRYLLASDELVPFRDKCRVIPLGIDVAPLSAPRSPEVRDIRQRYGDRIVLSVGRLVPYKGFGVLIRAMRHIDATLLLVGSGPLAAELEAAAAEAGVSHKVVLLHNIADLTPYYAAASVFVLPSVTRAESFGVVQIEAMAAGLPVVNTDIDSGVPEVSLDGQTGFTVPPGNETALAAATTLLLDREELRRTFSAAARTRVRTEFTADLMAARTMQLYDEVRRTIPAPLRRAA